MPVLGASSYAVTKRGLVIPAGSLDVWRAARANHASQRVEVVIFGDSTTWGSSNGSAQYGGNALYSWVAKLRSLSQNAGYTDGGRGQANVGDTAALSGENLASTTGTTVGWNAGNWFAGTSGAVPSSGTNGDTITWQGYGTAIRLYYGTSSTAGTFTYSVDGGAPVTVTPAQTANQSSRLVYISGLTDGLHTLQIVNTGTAPNVNASHSVDFVKSTGIVYHKNAGSGAAINSWFDVNNGTTLMNYQAALALGLDTAQTSCNGYGWGLPQGTRPNHRNPALAVLHLGINNHTTGDEQGILDGCEIFVRMCRAAGCDPVILIPPLQSMINAHTMQSGHRRAFASIARSHGAVLVDLDEVLGASTTWQAKGYSPGDTGDPHLGSPAYDAVATYLWQNVLSI